MKKEYITEVNYIGKANDESLKCERCHQTFTVDELVTIDNKKYCYKDASMILQVNKAEADRELSETVRRCADVASEIKYEIDRMRKIRMIAFIIIAILLLILLLKSCFAA